jgi:hypothetical protein
LVDEKAEERKERKKRPQGPNQHPCHHEHEEAVRPPTPQHATILIPHRVIIKQSKEKASDGHV